MKFIYPSALRSPELQNLVDRLHKEIQEERLNEKLNKKFSKYDSVEKLKGYYFQGIVIGVIQTLSSKTRYVVENPDGIIHIFNESQLSLNLHST